MYVCSEFRINSHILYVTTFKTLIILCFTVPNVTLKFTKLCHGKKKKPNTTAKIPQINIYCNYSTYNNYIMFRVP